MSTSEAELTLVIRARDMSQAAFGQLSTTLDKVRTKAGAIGSAFKGALPGMRTAWGQFTNDILNGRDLGTAAQNAAIVAGGMFAETLGATILGKIAASGFVESLSVTIAAVGTALGEVMGVALAAATALWPALLIAAIVAIIILLANNTDIRLKILEFGRGIAKAIVDGLIAAGSLFVDWAGKLIDFFWHIPNKLVAIGSAMVDAIIRGLSGLAQRIAIAFRQAIHNALPINIGPIHITETGVKIDLPDLGPNAANKGKSYAETHGLTGHYLGGWVGMNGPEVAIVGEHGPEYIQPTHYAGKGGGMGVQIVGVSERQIMDMIDRGLYVRLQRAAPTSQRA